GALERLVAGPQVVRRFAGRADARVLPGGCVDAVGDRDDLARVLHVAPHGARDLGVQLGDRVGAAGQAGAGGRHVERIAADLPHLPVDQLAAGPEPAQLGGGGPPVAGGGGGGGG